MKYISIYYILYKVYKIPIYDVSKYAYQLISIINYYSGIKNNCFDDQITNKHIIDYGIADDIV